MCIFCTTVEKTIIFYFLCHHLSNFSVHKNHQWCLIRIFLSSFQKLWFSKFRVTQVSVLLSSTLQVVWRFNHCLFSLRTSPLSASVIEITSFMNSFLFLLSRFGLTALCDYLFYILYIFTYHFISYFLFKCLLSPPNYEIFKDNTVYRQWVG